MDGKTQHTRAAAIGLWTTLALLTAVVASRRLAGAYTGPLPGGALALAVILAVTASVGALWFFRLATPRPRQPITAWLPELTAWGLPTLFALVIATQPTAAQAGTLISLIAMGLVMLGVAVLETTDWWQTLIAAPDIATESRGISPIVETETAIMIAQDQDGSAGASPSQIDDDETIDEEEIADDTTTQWMTRRQDADGEAIEGTVRVEFAPGQREVVLHVTFCPPLSAVPEVEFECVDGEDWQIKAEATLPYGLRIQVRRSAAVALEQSGQIAYLATAPRSLKAA